ncbi:MAG: 2-oxoacid:acceptor oxidoreductase subunit alpha [Gemmataceae bacterium]|nr:2-oxoacid:acceptor oxidoreductase subunit alpha [Gemmataceae bacterium]
MPCPVEEIEQAAVRFAGDSGDAMVLTGARFASASALAGNDVCTRPEFSAEIRAPAGTLPGVSGYQVHFSSKEIHTPGDLLHALFAMNPAALQAHLRDLPAGGLIVVNSDTFTPEEWVKAGFAANPLTDGSLAAYRVHALPMDRWTQEAVAALKLAPREAERCRSFTALGIACWLYDRPLDPTLKWIRTTFAKNPVMVDANTRALLAGRNFADQRGGFLKRYFVAKAPITPGKYRQISGHEATALGLIAAAQKAGRALVYPHFPSAPAGEIAQLLLGREGFDVRCVQAEDEPAAMSMAVGAAFSGGIGAVVTSGPGLSLASETLGLAVMMELPCVLIDVQRAGPSNGMPTKTEQSDLLAALFGRHGECPLVVLAPTTAAESFHSVYDAVRIAIRHMTPVIVLTDVALAASSETWQIPDVAALPPIEANLPREGAPFEPYGRDEKHVRSWAIPGMPNHEHRVGGLEKEDRTGHVSYDPANHEKLVNLRAAKIARIADDMPECVVDGPEKGELLVLGWGGTFGAIQAAARRVRRKGRDVAVAQLRCLHPLPKNLGSLLAKYRRILIPELNAGQLSLWIRAKLGVDSECLCNVQGRNFLVREIEAKIEEMLGRSASPTAPR